MTKYAEVLLCDHLSTTWEEKKTQSRSKIRCYSAFGWSCPSALCAQTQIALFVVQITHKRNYEISASAQILQQLP